MPLHSQDEFLWGADAKRIIELEDPMGRLLADEGWKELSKIGHEQANLRQEILLSSRTRPEGPSDDFLKGAIYGIRLLLTTPHIIMEQAKQLHDERAEDLNDATS